MEKLNEYIMNFLNKISTRENWEWIDINGEDTLVWMGEGIPYEEAEIFMSAINEINRLVAMNNVLMEKLCDQLGLFEKLIESIRK